MAQVSLHATIDRSALCHRRSTCFQFAGDNLRNKRFEEIMPLYMADVDEFADGTLRDVPDRHASSLVGKCLKNALVYLRIA